MCVLMLRGPQTPGELKQRAERMHMFSGLAPVEQTLQRLIERELVARLERRPGQKEERYAQLLADGDAASGEADPASPSFSTEATAGQGALAVAGGESSPAGGGQSLAELHLRVARLEREVAELRALGGVGRVEPQPNELPL